MATWTDLCYVRQTVCEEISEDFYNLYGKEITDYFQDKESEEISVTTIFAYCLGILMRNDTRWAFDYKEHFVDFRDSYFDAYYKRYKEE